MDALDLLFPKKCLGCGAVGRYICLVCLEKVRAAKQVCPYCENASIDGMTHYKCKRKFGLDGLSCLWNYEGVLKRAIISLKYKFAKQVGEEIINLTLKALGGHPSTSVLKDFEVLTSIPLQYLRQNWRGFNQSEFLGREVSGFLKIKFIPDLLIKKKITPSQTEVMAEERRVNVKNVFSLNSTYKLQSTDYIIFDDVFTTGSTLKEAAKVLKRAGAKRVWGLAVVR